MLKPQIYTDSKELFKKLKEAEFDVEWRFGEIEQQINLKNELGADIWLEQGKRGYVTMQVSAFEDAYPTTKEASEICRAKLQMIAEDTYWRLRKKEIFVNRCVTWHPSVLDGNANIVTVGTYDWETHGDPDVISSEGWGVDFDHAGGNWTWRLMGDKGAENFLGIKPPYHFPRNAENSYA